MSYNPTLGRFMQLDPLGYADGLNAYQFAGGNPISFVDPTGLLKISKTIAYARHLRRGLEMLARRVPTDGGDLGTSERRIAGQTRDIDKALGPSAVVIGVKIALAQAAQILWVNPKEHDWNFAMITKAEYQAIECVLAGQLKSEWSSHDDNQKTVYELGNGYGLAFYPVGGAAQYKTAIIRRGGAHVGDAIQFETGEQVNADIAEEYGNFSVVTKSLVAELTELRAKIADLPPNPERPRKGSVRERPVPDITGTLIYVSK
jgi:hypothetical protein